MHQNYTQNTQEHSKIYKTRKMHSDKKKILVIQIQIKF